MSKRGAGSRLQHPLASLAAGLVGLSLVVPLPVAAAARHGMLELGPASGPTAAAEEAAPDDRMERARGLYERGKAKFETAQYLEAIELWTEAYGTLPDEPVTARIKALLIYNIASAQQKAFEIQRDPKHLRQAKVLMESYAQSIPQLYENEDEAASERAKIEGRLQEIDDALAKAEVESETTADEDPADQDPEAEPTRTPSDVPDGSNKRRKTMLIAGGTLAGLGVVGLGIMAGGLAMGAGANDISGLMDDDIAGRRDQFDRGRTGNVMAWVGGMAGGALLVTGAVLVGLGARKPGKTAAAPLLGPGLAGMSVAGRF